MLVLPPQFMGLWSAYYYPLEYIIFGMFLSFFKSDHFLIQLPIGQNIQSVDAVALTRLRVKIIDNNLVDEDKLKAAGVEGILRLPDGILHLLVGLGAEQYVRNQ